MAAANGGGAFGTIGAGHRGTLRRRAADRRHAGPRLKDGSSTRKWIACVAVVCFLGLGLTSYLAYAAATQSEVAGCGGSGTFSCNHVLGSRWSKVLGVPVGLPAAATYVAMSIAACCLAFGSVGASATAGDAPSKSSRWCWHTLLFGSTSAAIAAVWFVGLQAIVLHHYCPYCLAAHGCGIVLLIVVSSIMPRGMPRVTTTVLAAAIGVFGMIATQILVEPPSRYRVTESTYVEVEPLRLEPDAADRNAGGDDLFAAPGTSLEPDTVGGTQPTPFAAPGATPPAEPTRPTTEPVADPTDAKEAIPATESTEGNPNRSEPSLFKAPISRGRTESAPATSIVGGFWKLHPATWLMATTAGGDEGDGAGRGESGDSGSNTAEPTEASKERTVPVSGGRRTLNVGQWPLYGSPEATYVVVKMFDYTCPHCQATHRAVKQAIDQSPNELAVVALPVPLYQGCNPGSQTTSPEYAYRCDIAKLAVAAWLVDRDRFRDFHDWLMERPRQIAEARDEADRRFGVEAITEQLAKPTAGQYVDRHVFLYREAGAGSLPKIVFPRTTVDGEVRTGDELMRLVRQNASPDR